MFLTERLCGYAGLCKYGMSYGFTERFTCSIYQDVSLTEDYVHMMTGPVFISIHYVYLELMIIYYWVIANAKNAEMN